MSKTLTGLYTVQYYAPNYPSFERNLEVAESDKERQLTGMAASHLGKVVQPEKPVVVYRLKDQEHSDQDGGRYWRRTMAVVYLRMKDADIGDYVYGENISYHGDRNVTIYHPETGNQCRWMAHFIGLEDGMTDLCWERLS